MNYHTQCLLRIKKAPNQMKIYQDFIKMASITREGLWMVCGRIIDFRFFVKFHRSGPAIIFSFWTITENVNYPHLIKSRFIRISSRWWVLLWKDYGWFVIELSIFDFSSNLHRSGPAIIFSFWTITENVNYPLLIKPRLIRTSSRWWVLLWKDYEWFLIEVSIFDFSSNFTRSDLQ